AGFPALAARRHVWIQSGIAADHAAIGDVVRPDDIGAGAITLRHLFENRRNDQLIVAIEYGDEFRHVSPWLEMFPDIARLAPAVLVANERVPAREKIFQNGLGDDAGIIL